MAYAVAKVCVQKAQAVYHASGARLLHVKSRRVDALNYEHFTLRAISSFYNFLSCYKTKQQSRLQGEISSIKSWEGIYSIDTYPIYYA